MKIDNVESILQDALKITDIGERMLFWHSFKLSFDKLPVEVQEAYKQVSLTMARDLVAKTYTLLGKEPDTIVRK